jgi:hypothetical protein
MLKGFVLSSIFLFSISSHAYLFCRNNHEADEACGNACNGLNSSVRWCVGRKVSCKCSNGMIVEVNLMDFTFHAISPAKDVLLTNLALDESLSDNSRELLYSEELRKQEYIEIPSSLSTDATILYQK